MGSSHGLKSKFGATLSFSPGAGQEMQITGEDWTASPVSHQTWPKTDSQALRSTSKVLRKAHLIPQGGHNLCADKAFCGYQTLVSCHTFVVKSKPANTGKSTAPSTPCQFNMQCECFSTAHRCSIALRLVSLCFPLPYISAATQWSYEKGTPTVHFQIWIYHESKCRSLIHISFLTKPHYFKTFRRLKMKLSLS